MTDLLERDQHEAARVTVGRWAGAGPTSQELDKRERAQRRKQQTKMLLNPWEAAGSEPGERGWTGAGGGRTFWREPPPEIRGTSVQVNGAFYPFGISGGLPSVGVPIGRTLTPAAERVSCDPISWFLANRLLSPIMFVLGLPALGKTSLIRQMVSIMPNWGITPIIMSDIRPGTDFGPVIDSIGGYRIEVGPGAGTINPLDPGPMARYIGNLPDKELLECLAMIRNSRINLTQGLLEIVRGKPLADTEKTLLAAGIDVLDQEHDGIPVLEDLVAVVAARHPRLRQVAYDRGDDNRYDDLSEGLLRSLAALGGDGPFGSTFAGQSSFDLDLTRPVDMDLSSIPQGADELMGAAQLATWSLLSSTVAAAKYLAGAGVIEDRTYLLVGDELHRPLKALPVIAKYLDVMIRLIRTLKLGAIFCTHTMEDLRLPDPQLTTLAWGFVEKSPLVVMGGLSRKEMGNLVTVFDMSKTEQDQLVGWTDQPAVDPDTSQEGEPPGRGKFLLKVGRSPGVAFRANLSPVVKEVNDTNSSWDELRAARMYDERSLR